MEVGFQTNGNFEVVIENVLDDLQRVEDADTLLARSIIFFIGQRIDKEGFLRISPGEAISSCLNLAALIPYEKRNADLKNILEILKEIGTGKEKQNNLFENEEELSFFVERFFENKEKEPKDLVAVPEGVSVRWGKTQNFKEFCCEFQISLNLDVVELITDSDEKIMNKKTRNLEKKLKSFYKDQHLIKA